MITLVTPRKWRSRLVRRSKRPGTVTEVIRFPNGYGALIKRSREILGYYCLYKAICWLDPAETLWGTDTESPVGRECTQEGGFIKVYRLEGLDAILEEVKIYPPIHHRGRLAA